MKELRDQLFDKAASEEYLLTNDVTSLQHNYYFGAGLMCGKYVRPNYERVHFSSTITKKERAICLTYFV